jgi:hypothetical protein
MTIDTARVEKAVRDILAEREQLRDPATEPVPAERNRLLQRGHLLGEFQSGIGGGHTAALKVAAREADCRMRHARVVGAIDEMARRSESGPERERPHWGVGARYLRDGIGYEVPGAIKAMCNELGIDRLPPLPTIVDELTKLQADLAVCLARLEADLDSWDRHRAVVHASIDAALPAVESHIAATVKERATTAG